jgi:hypothetical protein
VSFVSGSAVAQSFGMLITTEGCSSISDTAGNLLFYTDGGTIWDATGTAMPNGTGLLGEVSSSQSALIIRKPLSYTEYYVFTVDAAGGPNGFRYSVVDMTLNSGAGDVIATQKNVLLQDHVVEKLCAVNAANDTNVWVMVHGWGDNAFYAYQLTPAGIPTLPTISLIGAVHDSIPTTQSPIPFQNSYGYMKFSPNGHKLALAIGYQNEAELFDFDNFTGDIASPLNIPLGDHGYGVEFSPNSSRLYLTHYQNLTQTFKLDQWDITQPTPAAILASQTNLYTTVFEEVRAVQLGKDGRIYVAKAGEGALGVIYYPDSLGTDAFYQNNDLLLQGNVCRAGLPNFNASYFRELQPPVALFSASDSTVCGNGCINFTDLSLYYPDTWQWTFTGGTPSSSTAQSPGTVCYTAPGVYAVKLVVTNSKGSDSLTITSMITVFPPPASPVITASGNSITSTAATTYQWYYNNSPISNADSQSYTPTQTGNYFVVIGDANGCTASSNILNFVYTGIGGIADDNIKWYPNPVTDYLTLELPGLRESATLTVRNIVGSTLLIQELHPNSSARMLIDLRSLAPGVYTGEISIGAERKTIKLVKN